MSRLTPWWQRALVGMEVGPTGAQFGHSDPNDTRYCARFDGREIVRRCADAGCEYVVLWVRDGDFAYYDSKLLPKAPGLGHRDPLRDAVDEARRRKLPLIAYCVVQQGGHFLDAHPEFAMRGADGKPLGRFCLNSGYLEAMQAILAEQLAYGIDGFHIDMLDQGFGPPYGCWCESCRRRFAREFDGAPMPDGPRWDDAWDRMLEFRYRSSQRFEKALYAHVKALNPRASVDFNYHGNPPFSFEVGQRPVQHAGNADFVTGETGVWGFSALTVGLNAAFYRAATPGVRAQVAMQRGVRMYHDQTTRPLHDLRWELLTLLAHGAFVTLVDKTGLDGALDPAAYRRVGAAFGDARARRAHFGQTPHADVGIYYSQRTRDWIGRERPARAFAGFQGAHKALVYEHIPWRVLLDENADDATLAALPVVLLPQVGIVGDDEVARLRRYVEGGGTLLVTGATGGYDRYGRLQKRSSLESLTGARLVSVLESQDNAVRFPQPHPLADGIPVGGALLIEGPAAVFAPVGGATPLGELLRPQRTTRQREGREGTDWPMSPDTSAPAGPAALVRRVGKGTVLTLAASPDVATYGEHATVEARRLLTNAVRWLHPRPKVRITAPTTVEAVVTDDGAGTLRVHFLGYNAPPQTTPARERPYAIPAPIEDAPLFRVRLELPRPPLSVRAHNRTTTVTRQGARVDALIADIHDVLTVRLAP